MTENPTIRDEPSDTAVLKPSTCLIYIPEYSNEQFTDILRISNIDLNEEDFYGYKRNRKTVDRVSLWWQNQENIRGNLERLKNITDSSSTNLPPLEKEQIETFFIQRLELANNINQDIRELIEKLETYKKRPSVGKFFFPNKNSTSVEDVITRASGRVNSYSDSTKIKWMTMMLAVGEAIIEAERDINPRDLRQKIAQHAWTEIINLIPHAKVSRRKIDIIDELGIEKRELKRALGRALWDTERKHQEEILHKKLLTQVEALGNKSLTQDFETLYKATKGEDLENLSSLDLLSLQNNIWVRLYHENALEEEY